MVVGKHGENWVKKSERMEGKAEGMDKKWWQGLLNRRQGAGWDWTLDLKTRICDRGEKLGRQGNGQEAESEVDRGWLGRQSRKMNKRLTKVLGLAGQHIRSGRWRGTWWSGPGCRVMAVVEAVTSTDLFHDWQKWGAGTRVVGLSGFPVCGRSESGTLGYQDAFQLPAAPWEISMPAFTHQGMGRRQGDGEPPSTDGLFPTSSIPSCLGGTWSSS